RSEFPANPATNGGFARLSRRQRACAMLVEIAILGLFPAAMIYAAASDLVTMTISNRLSIALFLCFFAVAALIGMPFPDMGLHMSASGIVLVFAFGFFARGWIGGGDAKLA